VARASGLTASLLAHPVPGNLITPVDGPDHPAGTEVFTNDKFRSPPYPALRFYQIIRARRATGTAMMARSVIMDLGACAAITSRSAWRPQSGPSEGVGERYSLIRRKWAARHGDVLPQPATFLASSTVGTLITHSLVFFIASNE
jgi:hypothetical protein